MRKPLLLDLYCGQGGAAMGYHRAGFRVVGVDSKAQPRYPFEFVQADALDFLRRNRRRFAAIHASPPCQAHSVLRSLHKHRTYPDLIPQTRELLDATGLPYVIENVPNAGLQNTIMLCGSMFGLKTDCGAELRRHRFFEANWYLMCGLICQHGAAQDRRVISVNGEGNPVCSVKCEHLTSVPTRVITVAGHEASDEAHNMRLRRAQSRVITIVGKTAENRATGSRHERAEREKARVISVTGSTAQQNAERNVRRETFSVKAAQIAMGIDWMGMPGLSQAIPPAYTQYIGHQLMATLRGAA